MASVVKQSVAPTGAGSTASKREAARHRARWAWIYEIAVIAVGYWFYSLIRNSVTAAESDAIRHAHDVVRLERAVGLFHEKALNGFVAGQHWLAYLCNYYYATLHFLVTIGVGIWLYRRHQLHARQLRTAWYLMNVVALFGFAFFPLAPPRLLPAGGFTDTVVAFHTWGSWGDQSVSSHSNLYAAMPSMHIGWSLWVAISVVVLARRTWVRVLGGLYPLATFFVIVGTGNHYWLDAVGGALACLLGFLLARVITRRPVLPTVHNREILAQGRDRAPLDDQPVADAATSRPADPSGAGSAPAEEVGDQRDDDVRDLVERPVPDAR
jgi:hypothetical protein